MPTLASSARSTDQLPRILLECGNTLITGGNTGIQRVARNLSREGILVAKDVGCACEPVLNLHDRLLKATNWLSQIDQEAAAKSRHAYKKHPKLNASPKSRSRLQRLCSLLKPSNFQHVATRELRAFRSPRLQIIAGDVLVLADSWWLESYAKLQQSAIRQGATTGIIVYDLLPIRYPEFFDGQLNHLFRTYLDHYLQSCQFMLTISETVAQDLRNYAQERFGNETANALYIEPFRLGSDLDLLSGDQSVSADVQAFFSQPGHQPPYLTVGTVEPRKNHTYILDAFEIVWNHCPDMRLCIVGRPGWLNDTVINRIEQHPRLGKQLIWFSNAGDQDLKFCYEHSKALLFASHAEGFGLPLIEGLRYHLPVFASDIPVHREVGGAYASYFNIANPEHLAGMIIDEAKTGLFPTVKPWNNDQLVDWKSSAREFLQKCKQAAERTRTQSMHPRMKPS